MDKKVYFNSGSTLEFFEKKEKRLAQDFCSQYIDSHGGVSSMSHSPVKRQFTSPKKLGQMDNQASRDIEIAKRTVAARQYRKPQSQQPNAPHMDILKKFRYNFHFWLKNCYQAAHEQKEEAKVEEPQKSA